MNLRGPQSTAEYGLVAAVVAFAILPLVVPSNYWVNLGIDVMFVFLFALSFNLLFGYTGLLSFGQAAFFGIGAYAVPMLLQGSGFLPAIDSFLLVLVLAVVAATVAGVIIGFLCVRRGGIYFAMLTLAFSMMLYESFFRLRDLTGGDDGIIVPMPSIDVGVVSLSLGDHLVYYYFTFVLVALSTALIWRITRSPFGEVLVTIRENEERAAFIGIDVTRYKWASFTISSAFAGLAGAIASIHLLVVGPGTLHWTTSAEPVLIALIGGPTYFFGPLVGTIVFVALEETFTSITRFWQLFAGLVLLAIVLYSPGGLVGLWYERIEPRARELRDSFGGDR